MRTEDIARLGQLYLQKGMWNGTQLLPASWVEAATSRQVANGDNPDSDWNQGYGFQFWRCRHNCYRGDGAFGQYCAKICFRETPHILTLQLKFSEDQLLLDAEMNVDFGPTKQPQLVGRAR